jgi:hypothetical protein
MVICINSITLLVIFYIIGYIGSYVLLRERAKDYSGGAWVLMDKLIVLMLSLMSWLTLIIYLIVIILNNTDRMDPDKKCKW